MRVMFDRDEADNRSRYVGGALKAAVKSRVMVSGLRSGVMLLADRGFDADWIRALVKPAWRLGKHPPKRNRTEPIYFSRHLYRTRNLVDRFFNKIKQYRRSPRAVTSSPPTTSPSSN